MTIKNSIKQINPDINEYLNKVVKYFGSQVKLSVALDVHRQSISKWLNNKSSVPLIYAVKIEFLTNGKFRFFNIIDQETQSYLRKKHKSSNERYEDYK